MALKHRCHYSASDFGMSDLNFIIQCPCLPYSFDANEPGLSRGLISRALAWTPGIKLTSPESCREIPTAREKRRINDMLIPRGGLFHECVTLTQSDGAPPQVDEALHVTLLSVTAVKHCT